jgi:hypothetical protein
MLRASPNMVRTLPYSFLPFDLASMLLQPSEQA